MMFEGNNAVAKYEKHCLVSKYLHPLQIIFGLQSAPCNGRFLEGEGFPSSSFLRISPDENTQKWLSHFKGKPYLFCLIVVYLNNNSQGFIPVCFLKAVEK